MSVLPVPAIIPGGDLALTWLKVFLAQTTDTKKLLGWLECLSRENNFK